MEIKSSDLSQIKVSSRESSRGADESKSAPKANELKAEPQVESKSDQVNISDQAKLVAAKLQSPSQDVGRIQSKDEAASIAKDIVQAFAQKPQASLTANDPIARERISNLISKEPEFTREKEPEAAKEKATAVAQQVNQQPRVALESQANNRQFS